MAQQPSDILRDLSVLNCDEEQFDKLPLAPEVLCQVVDEQGLAAEEQVVDPDAAGNPKKRGRTADTAWTYLCEEPDTHKSMKSRCMHCGRIVSHFR
jgi:hypothetical protein